MKDETKEIKTPATTSKATTRKTRSARPARRTRKVNKAEEVVAPMESVDFEEDNSVQTAPASSRRKYIVTAAAILILAAIAVYKFQYLIVPAKVNGKPIFVWQYASYLNKTYGKEAMQTLTTQDLIEQEIAKNKISISNNEIQSEIDTIDKQASASGGIQAMLAAQQMTLDQLKEQIRIQLAVKKLLASKIAVSDAEVNDAYTKNKDFFKNVSETDAKNQIRTQLENQKFQQQASSWLADVKKNSSVVISYPAAQ